MSFVKALLSSSDLLLLISFTITILLSLRMYPVIIYINKCKGLMDVPDNRKIHDQGVPTHGGLGIFIAFSLAVLMTALIKGLVQADLIKVISLFLCSLILFFFGLKDDLVGLAPKKKFAGQVIAALIVIYFTDVRIHSLEGIFGIGDLPYLVSLLFTIFVFLLIINAYNLIDGIDGLAGSIAVLAGSFFGIFFLLNDYFLPGLVSLSMVAAVLGFLRFNLSRRKRLFMGDSGSLFLGFVLAWLGVEFLATSYSLSSGFTLSNPSMLLLAILCYPLLDTLRVFVIRTLQGRSPFSADRNHIHHRLLGMGLTHKQATLYIVLTNLVTVWIVFSIRDLNINLQLLLMLTLFPFMYTGPFLRIWRKPKELRKPVELMVENSDDNTFDHVKPAAAAKRSRLYVTKEVRTGPVATQKKHGSPTNTAVDKERKGTQTIVHKRVETLNKTKLDQEEVEKGNSRLKSG